ncbi:MAG: PA14 domain-containing protein, partial [Bacteroidota bacterium]
MRQTTLAGFLLLLIAGSILIPACQHDAAHLQKRGRDPWVFRSVLDEKARMLTIALQEDFWIAYDAQHANLYKVWQDGVNLDGAVYTTRHGPQPESVGNAFMENGAESGWYLSTQAGMQRAKIAFKGHRMKNDQVEIRYQLYGPGGEHIEVVEQPEYVNNQYGQPGLKRSFSLSHQPDDVTVILKTTVDGILSPDAIKSTGELNWGETSSRLWKGRYILGADLDVKLNPNGKTSLEQYFFAEPTQEPMMVAGDASGGLHPGLVLIENSDCKSCHNEKVKTIGPSYEAIAEKYRNTPAQVRALASKVMKGGSGVWGEQVMSGHPDLMREDAMEMVRYILALDQDEEPDERENAIFETPMAYIEFSGSPEGTERISGLAVNAYQMPEGSMERLPDIEDNQEATRSGRAPYIHTFGDGFGPFQNDFVIHYSGYLKVPTSGNFDFQLASDDGAKLYIDDQLVINYDGLHGAFPPMNGELLLTAGEHRFRLEYFEGSGGNVVSLHWIPYGGEFFEVIPEEAFSHDPREVKEAEPYEASANAEDVRIAGDSASLNGVHPSFDLATVRPPDFLPRVGGMDFLSDGRLVVSTWSAEGDVFLLDGVTTGDAAQVSVKRIGTGLAEPLGVKVVDDEIFVLQKQELTQLIDHDGDDVADEYKTVCSGWKVSANFHEFAFGLAYQDGHFYATLATAILPGGASANPQIPDRGKVVKINRETGAFSFMAHGLRTPNGIGEGVDGELFVADNQGDWLPASKIVHVREGAWYGSRSVDFDGTANLEEALPVVWLPQDEIGNSPSQPAYLNIGPYKGQMIHGEVTHGGVKRVFAEKVNGQYQGAVFRFTQGLEAGINRMAWGPDGALYVGGVGSTGNWRHMIGELQNWYGLQRL